MIETQFSQIQVVSVGSLACTYSRCATLVTSIFLKDSIDMKLVASNRILRGNSPPRLRWTLIFQRQFWWDIKETQRWILNREISASMTIVMVRWSIYVWRICLFWKTWGPNFGPLSSCYFAFQTNDSEQSFLCFYWFTSIYQSLNVDNLFI